MKHKITYREYKHSEAATKFSKFILYFCFFLVPIVCGIIYYTKLFSIPILIFLAVFILNSRKIEQYIARKYPDRPGVNFPAFDVSEQEYQRAMRITSLSVHSKEIKELAKAMGKTPQETMNYFTEVIKNYNLKRYSKKGEGQ